MCLLGKIPEKCRNFFLKRTLAFSTNPVYKSCLIPKLNLSEEAMGRENPRRGSTKRPTKTDEDGGSNTMRARIVATARTAVTAVTTVTRRMTTKTTTHETKKIEEKNKQN